MRISDWSSDVCSSDLLIGFVPPEQLIQVAEGVVTLQRDYGNRAERQHARLKYTIDHRGLDWFKAQLEERIGFTLQATRPYHFDLNGDSYGWKEGEDGKIGRAHV